jgi:acyl-CoA synthetase (NDP forming)
MLQSALAPRSIAVIGASDNPHKVGGRPILYLRKYGFRGPIYPVNPARATVQGLRAFARLEDLPEAPELAIVAVAGDEAVRAVQACAAQGVKVAVVMAAGFGETGAEGLRVQQSLVETARRAGMRMIGPNCQGLANFANGAVANFSTIFSELEPRDGPVAIVSQSGANSQAIYTLVMKKGLGVRHIHATGNEADVTVADLAEAVLDDPGVRLVLLYMEAIKDPQRLAAAAELARSRGVPIVALKAGRTARGRKAAASHTGALASEDRVVDAFFERHGIWRAADPHELVSAAALYARGRPARGKRLVVISNSGASCVMAADYSDQRSIPLAGLSSRAKERLGKVLPGFAALENPIDFTGALLGNPSLFGAVLPVVGDDAQSDLVMVALPVAGAGYDVPRFAKDLKEFEEKYGHATAVAAPQESVRAPFEALGIGAFEREREAMDALAQLAEHSARMAQPPRAPVRPIPVAKTYFRNEVESLALVAEAGLPVIEHRLCASEDEVRAAAAAFAGGIVMKACSRDVAHKSDHGLVALDPADACEEYRRQLTQIKKLGARFDGVIVARRAPKGRELALGARLDPQFGPVVLIGDGGIYLEALGDLRLLLPPFSGDEVARKLGELRIAPLLAGLRGEPPRDVAAFAGMAVRLGEAMLRWEGAVASIDINPVIVFETGAGAVAVDALAECRL